MENAGFTGPRIFLSSTSEFDAVYPHILASLQPDYPVYHWKQETARDASAKSHCRDMIRKSHVTVLLLGNSYGSDYDSSRSICEWEYQCAYGPPRVSEILAFVKNGWEITAEHRQKQHIGRITNFHSGHWCRIFKDDTMLIYEVRDSIRKWHLTHLRKFRDPDSKTRALVFGCFFFVLVVAALILTFLVLNRSGFTPTMALVGAIGLLCTAVAAMAAYRWLSL